MISVPQGSYPPPQWAYIEAVSGQINYFLIEPGGTTSGPWDIVLSGLPAAAIVKKAVLEFRCRFLLNSNGADNQLSGNTVPLTSQVMQLNKGGGVYADAINFIDAEWFTLANTYEIGDTVEGTIDLSAVVTSNDTYHARALLMNAIGSELIPRDCQFKLKVWYF